MNTIHEIRYAVRSRYPLIHCITNPISITQCANTILAAGARPIMAEHPSEVREITETADALMLNLGNITDARMKSIRIALQTAKEKKIPVVLDAVGIACSKLRRDYLAELLSIHSPTVIKGNYSEICALHSRAYHAAGVDAQSTLGMSTVIRAAQELAQKHHAAILASGKADIVTDGVTLRQICNGTSQLSTVTGTGCMLGALCGAYLSVASGMDAAAAACAVMGISGQMAQTEKGSGSFMVRLMDALSTLTDKELENLIDLEETTYETL